MEFENEVENESGAERSVSGPQAVSYDLAYLCRSIRHFNWRIVAMVLAIKAILLVYGAIAFQWLNGQRIDTWYGWLEIWFRWDSMRYIRIASNGYTNIGLDRTDLTGFPLYPWLVRLFSYVFQDPLISGFIVSGLATIAAGLLIYRLTRIDHPDTVAYNAVWFLFIFPTSYFLHIAYSESLFIALVLAAFLAARKELWMYAAIIATFACMTRVNGLIIGIALAVEALHQYRTTRRWDWNWAWLAILPLGFAIHLQINYTVSGDAFAFMTIGRDHYHHSLDFPWNGLTGVWDSIWGQDASQAAISGIAETSMAALGLICTIASIFWLRPSYAVWIGLNWLMFTSVGFVVGVPRYTLVLFPIYLLFARLAERPVMYTILTVTSLLFLAMYAAQFVHGSWAFG